MKFTLLFSVATLLSPASPLLQPARAEPVPAFRQLRIIGPAVLQRGGRHLLYLEGTVDGKTWKAVDPDHFTVRVSGAGRLHEDPAARQMNPFEVDCDDRDSGKVVIEARTAGKAIAKTISLGAAKPAGSFEATINPAESSHPFSGL